MQLVAVFSVVAVAVLSFLSGIAILLGSHKGLRRRSAGFGITALVVTVWAAALALVLAFPENATLSRVASAVFYVGTGLVLLACLIYMVMLCGGAIRERNPRRKRRFLLGLVFEVAITALILIFTLWVPRQASYLWVVVAPLAAGMGIVGFYYMVLRYRVIWLDARWLRVLSYIIVMTAASMLYMVIFYVVFTYVFKIENLPGSIFVLNYVMISVVLLLFPVMNEAVDFASGLVRANQVNMTYIVKQLNRMAPEMDLQKLAGFLADHLHFEYVGFWMNGRMVGSEEKAPAREELTSVSVMRDAHGEPFGEMFVGKPLSKGKLETRDLADLSSIANLVAALIDTGARKARRTSGRDSR